MDSEPVVPVVEVEVAPVVEANKSQDDEALHQLDSNMSFYSSKARIAHLVLGLEEHVIEK